MSFDARLSTLCDHREVGEDHTVEPSDNKTIYLDMPIGSEEKITIRYNTVPLNRYNESELLDTEDVTSQVTGSNSIFVVSEVPITDGSNKRQVASSIFDAIVRVFVYDEDASAQFTGVETTLVTQHRRLMSQFNVFATQLTSENVTVKVNSVEVEIESIEPLFGKIILKDPPLSTDTVIVTYVYRARISSIDGQSGAIIIRETPTVGQDVLIDYYRLVKDGWTVSTDRITLTTKIIFDRPKQTNRVLVQDEDVSDQFTGTETTFYTKYKPHIPPRAKLLTEPIETMVTDVIIEHNGQRTVAIRFDAETGFLDLGFAPKATDTVTVTYNYRDETAATDTFSIDYQAQPDRCRKCKATDVVNDYSYDKLGQLIIVSEEDKMLQDLLKLTTAIKGTNTAHPWYGTSLISFIGTARLPEYYQMKFKAELIDAGDRMKDLQNQQTQYQTVDDEEFFSFLDDIQVIQSEDDVNFYEVSATVVSQAATAIELTTDIMFNQQNTVRG